MSNLGDDLKKLAEELEAKKAQEQKRGEEEERVRQADFARTEARTRKLGEVFLSKAQQARDKSGYRLHLSLRYRGQPNPAFYLIVGKPSRDNRGMTAQLASQDEWKVSTFTRGGNQTEKTYRRDDDLANDAETLLKPLMSEALEALIFGKEEPGNE